MSKKIGLITMHNVCNMGAVLQAYALQIEIDSNGGNSEIIDYIPNLRKGYRKYFPKNQGIGKIRRTFSWLKWLPHRILWQKPYNEFVNEHLKLSKETFYENQKIYNYLFEYDVFVTGSDQVWNSSSTDGLSPYYFLDFAKGKKVSYAASISNKNLSFEEKKILEKYLSSYDAISVREKQAVELLEPVCKKDISFVLDPTLLLTKNEWEMLGNESNINIKENYLLIYMLGNVPRMLELAKKIAMEKKLKIVKFGWDIKKKKYVDYNISFKKPQDFIRLFMNADYIVTNSFHGTVFSINFKKDFVSIPSSKGNPRFLSILSVLGILDRLYDEKKEIGNYIESIDYEDVDKKLEELREKSITYIRSNIIGVK